MDEDEILRSYYEKYWHDRTQSEFALTYGINPSTLNHWLHRKTKNSSKCKEAVYKFLKDNNIAYESAALPIPVQNVYQTTAFPVPAQNIGPRITMPAQTALSPSVPSKNEDKGVQFTKISQLSEAIEKNLPTWKELVLQIGDINQTNEAGWTALHFACSSGKLDIVHYLVKRKANLEVETHNSCSTPLFIACSYGHLPIVQFLVESGANVNVVNGKGETPLYISCFSGRKEIVNFLLKNGAKRSTSKGCEKSPLEIAKKNKFEEIVSILEEPEEISQISDLLDGFKIDQEMKESIKKYKFSNDPKGNRFIMMISLGSEPVVRYLIKNGADVNASGVYPLHVACTQGHLEIVKLLLENRAVVNALNESKKTPLCLACENNHESVVSLLLCNEAKDKSLQKSKKKFSENVRRLLEDDTNESLLRIYNCCRQRTIHLEVRNNPNETLSAITKVGGVVGTTSVGLNVERKQNFQQEEVQKVAISPGKFRSFKIEGLGFMITLGAEDHNGRNLIYEKNIKQEKPVRRYIKDDMLLSHLKENDL